MSADVLHASVPARNEKNRIDNGDAAKRRLVHTTNTVIVGGGQSGLAMSRCLMDRGVNHIVLERGRLVERWRSERWDSLRLLTPNWMTRLPGNYSYQGDDADGFMTAQETIKFFEDYADSFQAPVRTNTEVVDVERIDQHHFRVQTNQDDWIAENLVVATGFCDKTRIPSFAENLPSEIVQLVPSDYKRPSQLPPGNVLIVGASATGCQIAEELMNFSEQKKVKDASSHDYFGEVTISVGRHARLPRSYRGRDILCWLYDIGFFSDLCHTSQERQAPAPQIIGTPEHRDLDLAILQEKGVRLVGRVVGVHEMNVEFADDLAEQLSAADAKLSTLFRKIDNYIEKNGINAPPALPQFSEVPFPPEPLTKMSIQDVSTIIWATGYERKYQWLQKLPSLLNENNDIVQEQGVTKETGLFVLGMRFQRTRISNFIDGVGADAEILADMLVKGMTPHIPHN